MRLLIIGSKGFIGSNLFNYYLGKNSFCYGADIVQCNQDNYFQINDENRFDTIFENYEFDYCINCSGSASVPYSLTEPVKDFELNTYNVLKILDAIRINQPKCGFVNLSSAAVYGDSLELPFGENLLPKPVSPYGFHKLYTEQICEEYRKIYSIRTFSLRIFSAYGIGLRKQILWDLVNKFVKNDVIEIYGTGLETRDFINIKDIIYAIDCVVKKGENIDTIVNIGNGIEIQVNYLVDLIKNHFGSQKKIVFIGKTRIGDPLRMKADVSKLSELGYRRSVDFDTSIKEYIEWATKEISG